MYIAHLDIYACTLQIIFLANQVSNFDLDSKIYRNETCMYACIQYMYVYY